MTRKLSVFSDRINRDRTTKPTPPTPPPSIDKFTNKSNGLSFLLSLCKKVTQFCFRFASFAFFLRAKFRDLLKIHRKIVKPIFFTLRMFQIWQNFCMIFRTRLDRLSDPQYYRDLQRLFGWIFPNNQYSVVFLKIFLSEKRLLCII